jgi:hypothetical protein
MLFSFSVRELNCLERIGDPRAQLFVMKEKIVVGVKLIPWCKRRPQEPQCSLTMKNKKNIKITG